MSALTMHVKHRAAIQYLDCTTFEWEEFYFQRIEEVTRSFFKEYAVFVRGSDSEPIGRIHIKAPMEGVVHLLIQDLKQEYSKPKLIQGCLFALLEFAKNGSQFDCVDIETSDLGKRTLYAMMNKKSLETFIAVKF